MRLVSTGLFVVCLTCVSLFAGHLASQGSISSRFVSDATLARVLGSNGGQPGGNGGYSCDNVNSGGADQYTSDGCKALTTVNANSTCVKCVDVNGTGYTSGNGATIVFTGSIDCTRGGRGSQKQTSPCEISVATGHGYCVDFIPNGQCTGSFNQYVVQGNPINPPG